MRLVRVADGHYETADGRYAVCHSSAGWFVSTVYVKGSRPEPVPEKATTKREAVSRLVEIVLSDSTSQ